MGVGCQTRFAYIGRGLLAYEADLYTWHLCWVYLPGQLVLCELGLDVEVGCASGLLDGMAVAVLGAACGWLSCI
jgi:hypothetical protein